MKNLFFILLLLPLFSLGQNALKIRSYRLGYDSNAIVWVGSSDTAKVWVELANVGARKTFTAPGLLIRHCGNGSDIAVTQCDGTYFPTKYRVRRIRERKN